MFDLLPLPVFFWKGEGELIKANQKAHEEFGRFISRGFNNVNTITPIHKFFTEDSVFDLLIDVGKIEKKHYRWISFIVGHSPLTGVTMGTRLALENKPEPDIYSQVFHELNNIITGVHMVLESSLEEKKPEKIKEYIMEGLLSIKRFSKVTSALSSILSGKRIHGKCDVNKVLIECITFARNTLKKGIRLNLFLPKQPYMAEIPEEFLYEIMINLLSNARDAIEGDGTIEVSLTGTKDYVQINISDTGKGIKEHEIASIFEPYYTNKTGGKGLGLYIVKKLVEIYGGKIEVRTNPGVGTTFILIFRGGEKYG